MSVKRDSEILKSLGRVIADRRKRLNLSQEEFAFKVGLDATYISRIECGTCNYTITVTCWIAKALDTTISELFDDAEAIPQKQVEAA